MSSFRSLYHQHKTRVLMFLIVGLISAIINFFSFALLWKVLGIDYRIAASISYILSIIAHFSGNRYITFKNFHDPLRHQILKYGAMVIINYLVILIVISLVVDILNLSPFIGIALGIGGTVILGYLLSRFWVFKTAEKKCDIV